MSSLKSFLTNNLSLLIMASYRAGSQVEKLELRNPSSFLSILSQNRTPSISTSEVGINDI